MPLRYPPRAHRPLSQRLQRQSRLIHCQRLAFSGPQHSLIADYQGILQTWVPGGSVGCRLWGLKGLLWASAAADPRQQPLTLLPLLPAPFLPLQCSLMCCTHCSCRNDAGLAAAELALAVERAVLDTQSVDTVGTTGHVSLEPNAINSVPRKAHVEIGETLFHQKLALYCTRPHKKCTSTTPQEYNVAAARTSSLQGLPLVQIIREKGWRLSFF